MAKLTDRQKNNLIAKYKTGAYTNIQLAKAYKITEGAVRKICKGVEKDNSDLVEAQVRLEQVKKYEISTIERKAVEQAVRYKLDSIEYKYKNIESVHIVANDILQGLQESIRKGKAQKVVTVNQGGGISSPEVVEYDMQPEHYEKASNALYKTGQTLGVIDNGKTEVNVQQDNKVAQVTEVKLVLDE